MAELNKANRQTCDVDIRIAKTKAPFLNFETANTTTAGLSADTTFAMAKVLKRLRFLIHLMVQCLSKHRYILLNSLHCFLMV